MKKLLKLNCVIMAIVILASSCHFGFGNSSKADSLKKDSIKKDSLKKDSVLHAKATDTSKADSVPHGGSGSPCGGVHPPCMP
jgi:hypothetical protein